jgi:hypothetical protein
VGTGIREREGGGKGGGGRERNSSCIIKQKVSWEITGIFKLE